MLSKIGRSPAKSGDLEALLSSVSSLLSFPLLHKYRLYPSASKRSIRASSPSLHSGANQLSDVIPFYFMYDWINKL